MMIVTVGRTLVLIPYHIAPWDSRYPRDAACDGAGISATFATLVESKVQEIGFWANDGYMGESWHAAMAAYLRGA
jgi:hypothetical protein